MPARIPLSYTGVAAPHGLVGAPLGAADDVGRLAGCSGVPQTAAARFDRRLRRADQHGVDVLAKRLLDVGGHVAEARLGGSGCRRGRRRAPGGSRRSAPWWCGRRRPVRCRGRRVSRGRRLRGSRPRTRAPRSRRASWRGPGRRAGQVVGGQRHHRERGVLVDLADRLAAADAGQRLLRELGCRGHAVLVDRRAVPLIANGNITAVAAIAVNSSDGRGTTTRHGPMLRMCQLLPVFRHGSCVD